MDKDYVLDYAVGQFVLWNKKSNYEIDISEESALKYVGQPNVMVTKDAKGRLDSLAEDLEDYRAGLYNGMTFNGLGL